MPFQNLHAGFLGTRVGRRTLLHFLLAAMLPVLVSSLLGVWYVRQTLTSEAAERVERTADAAALILLRQLSSLASNAQGGKTVNASTLRPVLPGELTEAESKTLREGGVVLRVPAASASPSTDDTLATVLMLSQATDGTITARAAGARELWSGLDELIDGNRTDVCVFSVITLQQLHCNSSVSLARAQQLHRFASDSNAVRQLAGELTAKGDGRIETADTRGLLVASRDVYLRYAFASASWRVIAAENRAEALAPAATAINSLLLLIGVAMVSAFAFAHAQIRRSTQPLEALHNATRRAESGDLLTPVSITSEDEYGDLGAAFNVMTSTLSRQLMTLRALDDVDQATLREGDLTAIAATSLQGLRRVRGVNLAAIALLNESSDTEMSCWWTAGGFAGLQQSDAVLEANVRACMFAHPRHFILTGADPVRWLPVPSDATPRAVFPLLHDGALMGAIAVSICEHDGSFEARIADLQRIADRVALGVANVRMLDQLNALSSGTLLAFARAIDANSPWTAGHSERVTQLSIALGRQLGLPGSDLAILYRGGLMHDIGKIGIPTGLLDKAGRLDDSERALIEKHPEIGERILRPIAGFADALCIVRSHHERFDGSGYPDRLAGERIPWFARIVAVADVFDALASDRPYRKGLTQRATITMIEGESGKHFDPRVVDALLALERENSPSLLRQSSLRELPTRTGSLRDTPNTPLVAVA